MHAEMYRTRFLEAMERYFLLVPDPWTHPGLVLLKCSHNLSRDCNCMASRQAASE